MTFGMACAPTTAAEPWYSWKRLVPGKSTPTQSSPAPRPASARPPATQPATASTATTPTFQNRQQRAPISAGATPQSAASNTPREKRTAPPPTVADSAPRGGLPAVPRKVVTAPSDVPPEPTPIVHQVSDEQFVPPRLTPIDHEPVIQTVSAVVPAPPTKIIVTKDPQPMWRPRDPAGDPQATGIKARSAYQPAPKSVVQSASFQQPAEIPPPPPASLETPPAANKQFLLPIDQTKPPATVQLTPAENGNELISLTVRDASLSVVLGLLAEQHGLNIVAGGEVEGRVTVTLNNVGLDDALNALLTVNGYSWHRNRNILVVSKVTTESKSSPELRGVTLRVFRLNYISAEDVERVVTSLLSPAGRAVTTMVDSKNTRRTREEIVVEDLPEYLARIEAYIAEVDVPPRQVLIEAHVLQVSLKDDLKHGVDIQHMFDISGTKVSLQTTGLANPKASPAFFFGIDNNNFHSLLETLKTTTDAKTLATPQVLCLNGQHAKIQIGQQLGFLVTTTTQTSTLQNVNFLDVGVVLDVTPTITDEGLVMLQVKPEVSGGQINAAGLPQEDTTEVETTVMLADGSGMIIGGLIKEEDTEVQTKVPYIGDMWLTGRLFQRRTVVRQRNEVIIALVPYIVPHPDPRILGMDRGLDRARTRLVTPELDRFDRREWEPDLPDAIRNPRMPFSGEIKRRIKDPYATSHPPLLNPAP
ncbi:MAG TPA: secretin N-terminal domain-containing protein [Planctomycetaceae bacterium]|nr:secretin N-terminal domain-containing protein [Planctomycetaceae bacterium]